jgi:hypothetical protein
MKVGELYAVLGLDTKGFDSKLNKAEGDFSKAGDKMTRVTEKLNSTGKKMSMYVTAPIAAAGAAMVKMSMDAVESENLFSVSMGKMEKQGRQFSEEFGRSLGLNDYNIRKMMGTFNVMLNSMGMTEKQAYSMSEGFTKLAYDMASFYNLPIEEAFIKLQAGISGEVEPLKRLGILVNENTIKTYAYTHGIAEQGAQLTEQQKVMARYGVIMEQTKKAQGDLTRTQDTASNQTKILKEQTELLAIELGKELLPAFKAGVGLLVDMVKLFKDLPEPIKKFAVFIGATLAVGGPVLVAISHLITAWKAVTTTALGAAAAQKLAAVAGLGGAGTAAAGTAAGGAAGTAGRIAGGGLLGGAASRLVASPVVVGGAIAHATDWLAGTVTGQGNKRLGNGGWLPNLSPVRALSEGYGAAVDYATSIRRRRESEAFQRQNWTYQRSGGDMGNALSRIEQQLDRLNKTSERHLPSLQSAGRVR